MNTLSLWTAYNKVTQPRGGSLVSVDSLQQSYSTQGWIPCLCGQLTTKLLNPGVDTLSLWTAYNKVTQPRGGSRIFRRSGGGAMVMHGRMLTARGECGRAECPRAKCGSFWPQNNLLLPMLVYLS